MFDLAKRLEQLVRAVPNDSKLLHQIAQCAGFKEIVQIGANCGIRNDPVRALVVKYRTKTLLVEPDPIAFEQLQKSYAYLVKRGLDIRFVNAYVSPKDIDLRYYSLSPSGRRKASKSRQVDLARKSGTDKNRLLEYLRSLGYKDAEELVSEQSIQNVSWQDLLSGDLRGLLVIDTEGLDWKLLLDFDLSAHHPCAVYFETGPSDTWDPDVIDKFENAGYHFMPLDKNALFVEESMRDRLAEQ
ncbi:FkbM family methyltransferase [Thioalkalivibrio sp. ALMg13-2]|uniref:FkbM family methyltransferase n=1 Tax=Thioalkalivibrio sp. ALMg13-2 TaxID=1158167 RepID=UPI0012DC720E|nr:FkbM family methyltransferase [Thioalkalivibrio sp. ALMg13-2]